MVPRFKKLILHFSLALILLVSGPTWAYAQDIYFIYAGSDKSITKELKSSLPQDLEVKSYNIYMLAMADYTGKQKIIAKIEKAKLIVMVSDTPADILGDHNFNTPVITVSDNSTESVKKILKQM